VVVSDIRLPATSFNSLAQTQYCVYQVNAPGDENDRDLAFQPNISNKVQPIFPIQQNVHGDEIDISICEFFIEGFAAVGLTHGKAFCLEGGSQ